MNPLHQMTTAIARLRLRRTAHRRLEEVLHREKVASEAYGRPVMAAVRRLVACRGIAVVGVASTAALRGRGFVSGAAVIDVTDTPTGAVAAQPGSVTIVRPLVAPATRPDAGHVERVASPLLRGAAS